MAVHVTVLRDEAIHWLQPRPGGVYADATVGLGGHAEALLRRAPADVRLLAIDRDAEALALARERLAEFAPRVRFFHAAFSDLGRVLDEAGVPEVDGLLADLGVSSPQLDRPERGFSFQSDGPLDMRMDRGRATDAAALVAGLDERTLADLLYRFGEERQARRIARAICAARARAPIVTTGRLAQIVREAIPGGSSGRHPATRTFQALRIAVNDELGELERLLAQAPERLREGGRLVLIAFHSLEDRMIKDALRAREPAPAPRGPGEGLPPPAPPGARLRVLTRKVVTPTEAELRANPRARSARLRAAERLPAQGRRAAPGEDTEGAPP